MPNEIDLFDAPIAGQSLTTDVENPLPFETPPEFTDKQQLVEGLFEKLMEPDNIAKIAEFLNSGMSVEAITKMLLFTGMASGKFNVDMQLLLIEPVVYMIIFIAERTGIDPVLEEDEYLSKDIEEEIEDMLGQEIKDVEQKLPKSLLSRVESEVGSGGET
jgi:hypothetical protein